MSPKNRPKRAEEAVAEERESAKAPHAGDETVDPDGREAAPGTGADETADTAAAGDDAAANDDAPVSLDGVRASALADELAELTSRFAEAEAAWAEKEDSLLRLLAERDNQIKRKSRDMDLERNRFRGEILEAFVAVLDDFDRALAQETGEDAERFVEGFRLISERMREVMSGFGLTPIDALGEKFDPQFHEAMIQMEVEGTGKGVVVQEIQKGYMLDGRVLRASKVAVSR